MIKVVLFDLDGTLLPMDQDVFVNTYFKRLTEKLLPYGYDPKQLIDGVWAGTAAMVKNDGSCTNEEAFWRCVSGLFGERILQDKPIFEEYYRIEFQEAANVCGYNPQAKEVIEALKRDNYRLALATNPLFPAVATESRIAWAGLEVSDFELYTIYENSRFCKPNPDYYRDLVEKLNCSPKECLMVGNDVEEDMVAQTIGMHVFLLTDCLINKKGRDLSLYPHEGFLEFYQYLKDTVDNL